MHNIDVYDGVFNTEACSRIHAHITARGLGHALYTRALRPPGSPIEQAIDSFLIELGDTAPVVEYWSREAWRNLDAHADVDEGLAATQGGALRYPSHAHVMYAEVGDAVQGPTCVWAPSEEPPPRDKRFGDMTVVPAVKGRLLRFTGSLAHAVPRPANVWFLPFVRADDIDAELTAADGRPPPARVRAVVLFNTWPDASAPPMGVLEFNDEGSDPSPFTATKCQPKVEWSCAPIAEHLSGVGPAGAQDSSLRLGLLGDRARRGQLERVLKLPANEPAVLNALFQRSNCMLIHEVPSVSL